MENGLTLQIWLFLAGLGVFLFGMYLMEESIRSLASRSFKIFLRKQTGSPIKAVLSGTVTTAILQSSTLVTLLVMTFTSAGIIGLKSGIGIILGANLGTTATGWMISLLGFKLNIETYILPFLAIGGLGISFLKNVNLANICKLIIGFAFIFIGIGYIKESVADFASNADLSILQDKPLILFLLFGVVLTAALHSSSASIAIYLSALAVGIIDMHQAIFLVIGSDLGTTATAMLGTINANAIKKKTGWAHFYFNIIQSTLAILLFKVHLYIITKLIGIKDDLIILVFIQTSFNLLGIIVVLPFLNRFTDFINRTIRSKEVSYNTHLQNTHPEEFISSIESLKKESLIFAEKSIKINKYFLTIEKINGSDIKEYSELKDYENEITAFYLKVQQNSKTVDEANDLNSIIATFRLLTLSVKDVKDVKHNMETLKESADDINYNLYELIKTTQSKFYILFLEKLESLKYSKNEDSRDLEAMQRDIHTKYIVSPFIYKNKDGSEKQIDFSSTLNLLREINNSNEYLIEAYNNLLKLNHT